MPLTLTSIAAAPPSFFEELQKIRALPGEPRQKPPPLDEWQSRPEDQTLVHARTGCRFKALRLEQPIVEGFRVPFVTYEVGAQFIGMAGDHAMPAAEEVLQLGRQGIAWILTYTYEARAKRAGGSAPTR